MRRELAALFALFALVLVGGCGPSPEAIERERVLGTIDALRDAPKGEIIERTRLLEELERSSLKTPVAARARDACLKAYRPLLEALELERAVKQGLEGASPPDPMLLTRIATAEAKVEQSSLAMPGCEQAVAALRLTR